MSGVHHEKHGDGDGDDGGGGERGSGSVLAVAIVAVVVVFGVSGVGLAAAMTARQRTIGSADLAALAAADAASGAIAGAPCEVAERVAHGNGSRVARCHVEGLVVTMTVAATFAGIPIAARSTAGPPP